MLETRVIPCLLLHDGALVKTIRFGRYQYIGDPLNTCRIFNELEVDEMILLDIQATKEEREPDYFFLEKLASECFMPLAYGGGIRSIEQAKKIFSSGYEKLVINSALYKDEELLLSLADFYGSQSIVASVDVKRSLLGRYEIYSASGTHREKRNLVEWVKRLEELGAGEVMLTNIDREGTWRGLDCEVIREVADAVNIPVIAHGGAGSIRDVEDAVNIGHASAVALGSMVVYQKQGMGVLINYPKGFLFDRKK